MMRKPLIISLLLIINTALAGYYADVELIIDESGSALITGLTNHPILSGETSNLTSKQGVYWTINLTINELFDYYVLKALLPQGSEVNYLKSSASVRISEESGSIAVTTSGSNETISLVIQYSVEKEPISLNWLWSLLGIPVVIIAWFVIKKKPKKKKIDHSLLTKRESLIIKLVEQKDRITQRELEKSVKLPKASLSRNINSLVKKGLVKKEKKGLTNLIIIEK